MHNSARKLGQWGEKIAEQYLKDRSYKVVSRHYHTRKGEIDIIVYDNDELVFVEVKTRSSITFGWPEESIDYHKSRKIEWAVESYINEKNFKGRYRFDVILIFKKDNYYNLRHIKSAEL